MRRAHTLPVKKNRTGSLRPRYRRIGLARRELIIRARQPSLAEDREDGQSTRLNGQSHNRTDNRSEPRTSDQLLIELACEATQLKGVICRVRPGTLGCGPAPVPRMTSLVPLAFFSAVWASLAGASQPLVATAFDRVAVNRAGIVARLANRLRRESRFER